jgi:hypothetical protein
MSNSIIGYPRQPDYTIHGAEFTAPAAATVLARTPAPVLVQFQQMVVVVSLNGDDSLPTYEIAHRNATNSADVEATYVPASAAPGLFETIFSPMAPGETIVARNKTAGTAGKIYQVDLYVWGQ